jgi:hypothetical protein
MPLAFWNNRIACVVTGEVFGEPDGYVFIYHEFIHRAQWDCCEQKLKEGLARYLVNRLRDVVGLSENRGGENPPFTRVTFYSGGDKLIRFLERR